MSPPRASAPSELDVGDVEILGAVNCNAFGSLEAVKAVRPGMSLPVACAACVLRQINDMDVADAVHCYTAGNPEAGERQHNLIAIGRPR
jgi:hypothetical protein